MRFLKRNLFPYLLLVLFFLTNSSSAHAAEQKVYDQAELFSKTEITEIEAAISSFEKSSQMEAVVVTTNDNQTKSARDYADDFYDQHHFGYGEKKSGLLFLIDLTQRTYWISTHGHTITLLTDNRIDSILDKAETGMKNGEYSDATLTVLKQATTYSDNYAFDSRTGTFKKTHRLVWYEILIAAILAVIGAGVTYGTVYSNYNLKRRTYTYPYRDYGRLNLSQSEDRLVHSATTSRYIPPSSNNNSGGGSSTHRSSGGSTHGGGGRSF